MAGMKRFVTYIYTYEEGKKGTNAGFAKIEVRGADCRIEIHLKGVFAWRAVRRVYLFRKAGDQIEGIRIGEIRPSGGSGSLATIVGSEKIGNTPFGIGDMEGIFMLSEDDRIFMSRWREGDPIEVRKENFHEWKPDAPEQTEEKDMAPQPEAPREPEPEVMREPQPSPTPQPEAPREPQPSPAPQGSDAPAAEDRNIPVSEEGSVPVAHPEEKSAEESVPVIKEAVQATEIPMRNILPGYDWQAIWENLTETHPLFTPFDDRETVCIQIELRELRDLPRRYWYLGNNSFLLHGFFNYRYLVVGKTSGGRWFLGVPGIYQRQERVMAAIFGFPEFIPTAAEEDEEETGEPVNRFGCWYRYIEE